MFPLPKLLSICTKSHNLSALHDTTCELPIACTQILYLVFQFRLSILTRLDYVAPHSRVCILGEHGRLKFVPL